MGTELKKQLQTYRKKSKAFLKQWYVPLLVIAIGLLLVLLPLNSGEKTDGQPQTQSMSDIPTAVQKSYVEQTEQRLSEVLSSIDGAGRVEVMLTVQGSEITYFQTDTDTTSTQNADGTSSSAQYKTVILSGSGEYDKAAVTKTEYPMFRGALIVSEGADNSAVRLALVNAVSSLLGLGTDKISVVKMK